MDIQPIGNTSQLVSAYASNTQPAATTPSITSSGAIRPDLASTVQESVPAPTKAQLNAAVKEINKAMESMSQGLEFSVDSDSHRDVVKVVDQSTQEVIRQIPSRETLEIAKVLDQLQGLLIRQKA